MALPRDFVAALKKTLDRRREVEREVVDARVLGRAEDGTTLAQRLDGECIGRGCPRNEYAGQVVQRGASSCFSSVGTSGVALLALSGTARILWVERLDPHLYEPGGRYTVTVEGRGFTASTRFEFLLAESGDINPAITLTGSTWLDSQTFELEIEVSPEAPALVGGDLAYGDEGIAF